MARDSEWVHIARKCYKKFDVVKTWNFRPWMPLVVDLLRIIATTLECFVILLGIIQDYLVKKRLKIRRLACSLIITASAITIAACILIRKRVDVYGCAYEQNIDRYRCLAGKQSYSAQFLSSAQINSCDAATLDVIRNETLPQIFRLDILDDDRGDNIASCTNTTASGKAIQLGRYNRHALLNQFFGEAAIISGVFLAVLVLAILAELYIVIKGIFLQRDLSFYFLMGTLALIVLKELYPIFSGLRKIHDKTESYNLIVCGCMFNDYDEYTSEILDQLWGLVALLFIADVAVTFSKVVVEKRTSNNNHEEGSIDDVDDMGDIHHIDPQDAEEYGIEVHPSLHESNHRIEGGADPWANAVQPPESLRPRHLIKFFRELVRDAPNHR